MAWWVGSDAKVMDDLVAMAAAMASQVGLGSGLKQDLILQPSAFRLQIAIISLFNEEYL